MIIEKNITWQVKTLTPLHIGDGEELQENFDFICAKDGLQVLDIEKLLDSLAADRGIVREIGRGGFNLKSFLKQYKLMPPPVLYNLSCQTRPSAVRRFLKDGHGQPYLAGSSLKGALRTAVLATLDRNRLPSPNNKKNFATEVNRLDGSDAHRKLTRMLQVSDSVPLSPNDVLEIADIRFFNLGYNNKPLWKDFSSKKNMEKFQDAKGIFVETVKPGQTFTLRMAVDPFLLNKNVRKFAGIQSCPALNSLDDLCRAVNRHSLEIAGQEAKFFRKYGQNSTADFYTRLQESIENISKNDHCCIVRLAWGSGWTGMTGGWLAGDDLNVVRKNDNLGKSGCPICNGPSRYDKKERRNICKNSKCGHQFRNNETWFHPIFPKTRRLTMADGLPSLPLGWVNISITDKGLFTLPPDTGEGIKIVPPGPPEQAQTKLPVDPAEERGEKLRQFVASLPSPADFPAQAGAFISQVKAMNDEILRGDCCREILTLVKKLPKKKKLGKKIQNGKKWALSLQALCDDNGISISD